MKESILKTLTFPLDSLNNEFKEELINDHIKTIEEKLKSEKKYGSIKFVTYFTESNCECDINEDDKINNIEYTFIFEVK